MAIGLGWLVSFGMLAIAYVRTKRWDRAWKERWERRHATSLEALRQKTRRTLKAATMTRWMMLALFFMSVGAGFGPIITAIKGLHREPMLMIVGFAALDGLALLALALTAAGVGLLRYRIRRIDELLAAEPQH